MPPRAKQQIEKDTAGEFATIRRANLSAKANSIVTDSNKPDPLKSIKLFRSEALTQNRPTTIPIPGSGPAPAPMPIRMDFSKISLRRIPLLTSSMSMSAPVVKAVDGNKRAATSTSLPSDKPQKLPRLIKFDGNAPVSSLQNTSPNRSPRTTPHKGKQKTPPSGPQSSLESKSTKISSTQEVASHSVSSTTPALRTSLSKIPLIKFDSQAIDTQSDIGIHSEVIENSIEGESQSVKSTSPKKRGRPKKNTSNASQSESEPKPTPPKKRGRPKKSTLPIPLIIPASLPKLSRSSKNSLKTTVTEINNSGHDEHAESEEVTMNKQVDKSTTAEKLPTPDKHTPKSVHGEEKFVPEPEADDSGEEFFDAMDVDTSSQAEITPAPEPIKPKTRKKRVNRLIIEESKNNEPKIFVNQENVNNLQNKILPKLNGKTDEEPYCINDKILELEKLIKSVVVGGESHSCVVFGPRNSGKTSAFQSALRRVREDISKNDDFIYININGLAQDTDTLAVRSIADQLDTEITRMYDIKLKDLEVGELLSRKSITNTFANVLKVLDDEVTVSGDEDGKLRHPIVFSIDEVDVYAQQNRQTLLYNLFDLAENSKTPICVVCFTSKFTFKELLEKRVRSRFSQRTITFRRLPQDRFLDTCAKLILVDDPENDYEKEWNRDLLELVQDRSSSLRKAMVYNHLSQANIKEFQNQCVYPIARLSVDEPRFSELNFAKYAQNQSKSSFVRLVNSLSDLESFLLVSAARVIAKTDMSWVNLNIVYEEYLSQLKAQQREVTSSTGFGAVATTGFKTWSKESCKHPWETLRDIGFLSLPGTGLMKSEFVNSTFETRMWQVELTLDELRRVVYTAKPVKTWTRL